jgi:hypothetical protein
MAGVRRTFPKILTILRFRSRESASTDLHAITLLTKKTPLDKVYIFIYTHNAFVCWPERKTLDMVYIFIYIYSRCEVFLNECR